MRTSVRGTRRACGVHHRPDGAHGKRAGQDLKDAISRLQAIVETAADGIVTIDETGIIESVTCAVSRLFGYPATELVGRSVTVLMPEPHRDNTIPDLARYLCTGKPSLAVLAR